MVGNWMAGCCRLQMKDTDTDVLRHTRSQKITHALIWNFVFKLFQGCYGGILIRQKDNYTSLRESLIDQI